MMVLSAGKIVEFDSPAQLLRNERSIFTALVNETGAENAAMLTKIANQREKGIKVTAADVIGVGSSNASQTADLSDVDLHDPYDTKAVEMSHSVNFHF